MTPRPLEILMLSLVFPPDSVSTGELMADLAEDLNRLGHRVTVVSTVPHYNPDTPSDSGQVLRPWWGSLLRRSDYRGMTVLHAAMPRKSRSVAGRILAWINFHMISTAAALVSVPRPDVIFTPSPPLSIGVSAWIVGLFRRAPYIYNVQEIYPDIAVTLGALTNRRVIRLLERLERFVYDRAAMVTVIAPRMRERLLNKGVPADKVRVVPNFVDMQRLAPVSRQNEFSRRFDLDTAFTVTYAGNMGPAQGLGIMLDAARLLADAGVQNVRFLLIGEGILRTELTAAAERLLSGLVQVLPYQPAALMPQIYGASDINLVPLAAAVGSDAVPSKVYRIMASGRPVVAIADEGSDLAVLVRDADCGAVIRPGDAEGLAELVRTSAANADDWRARGLRGRAYVDARYSRRVISAEYEALLQTVVTARRDRRS